MATPLNTNGPMPPLNYRKIGSRHHLSPAGHTNLSVHKVAENSAVFPQTSSFTMAQAQVQKGEFSVQRMNHAHDQDLKASELARANFSLS